MSSDEPFLRRLATILCCGPLLLEVARMALDQSATTQSMAVIGAVALFGLPAYLGHKWALAIAPFVFLMAAAELVVMTIFDTLGLHYWFLIIGLSWCGYELAVATDVRAFLKAQTDKE